MFLLLSTEKCDILFKRLNRSSNNNRDERNENMTSILSDSMFKAIKMFLLLFLYNVNILGSSLINIYLETLCVFNRFLFIRIFIVYCVS